MVIDSSVLVAILLDEPDAPAFASSRDTWSARCLPRRRFSAQLPSASAKPTIQNCLLPGRAVMNRANRPTSWSARVSSCLSTSAHSR